MLLCPDPNPNPRVLTAPALLWLILCPGKTTVADHTHGPLDLNFLDDGSLLLGVGSNTK